MEFQWILDAESCLLNKNWMLFCWVLEVQQKGSDNSSHLAIATFSAIDILFCSLSICCTILSPLTCLVTWAPSQGERRIWERDWPVCHIVAQILMKLITILLYGRDNTWTNIWWVTISHTGTKYTPYSFDSEWYYLWDKDDYSEFLCPQKLFWTNSHMYMYTKINNECHEIFLSLFIDCRIQNNNIKVLLKI